MKSGRSLRRLVLGVLVVLLLAAMLSGCTKARIIGEWQEESAEELFGSGTITFYRDGTLTVNVFGMDTAGSYEFIDGDTIRIEMSGLLSLGGAQVFDVEINGDTMTLSNGMITTRYRRVQ